MKTQQHQFTASLGWTSVNGTNLNGSAQLVLAFGNRQLMQNKDAVNALQALHPNARIIGCSTSGEILGTAITDDTINATAVNFSNTTIEEHYAVVENPADSYEAAKRLIAKFDTHRLKHVFVLSDGLNINGSELVRGINDTLPPYISATGGLAGDGADFKETIIIGRDTDAMSNMLCAIGLYSDTLEVGYGSFGGWDSFGIERLVTKAEGNVLYELDGQPALALYKSFLGAHAAQLPASGLLFPLSMRTTDDSVPVVRTILAVNEANQSLTFAGDIPQGSYVKLMKANVDRLVNGAVKAATTTQEPLQHANPQLAILISCVGRKLVLKQMAEEEVEGVKSILGNTTTITGFYSYGEISPFSKDARCELHNQTMTITTFTE
jgi:hypothetical protein